MPGDEGISTHNKRDQNPFDDASLFEAAFNISVAGVALLELDTRIIKANQTLCQMLAYTPEELYRMLLVDIVHPEDKEMCLQAGCSLEAAGRADFELRLLDKKARTVWTRISCAQVSPKKEGASLLLAQFLNLSPLRKTEEDLRQSKATLESLLQAAPMGIGLVTDRSLGWTNQAFSILTGYSSQELLGRSARMLYESEEEFQRVALVKHPQIIKYGYGSIETRFKRKDGELVDVLLSSAAVEPGNLSAGLIFTVTSIARLKKAEQALRESEKRYRSLFQTMVQGVVYQDAQGAVIEANPAAQHILGLSLEEMQGRDSLDERWHSLREDGSLLPGNEHTAMIALATGKPVQHQIMGVYNPRQGEHRWLNVSAVPEFKSGGDRPYRVYTTFTDITERRRAEEELRRSRTILDQTQKMAKIGGWEFDLQSQEETWTEAIFQIFELSPQEKPDSNNCLNFVLPEYRSLVEKARNRALESGDAYDLEIRARTNKGRDIWVRCLGQGHFNKRKVIKLTGAIQDITERKNAEAALRLSEEKFSKAFQASPVWVVLSSLKDGRYLEVNETFLRTTGYTRAEVIGRTSLELGIWADPLTRVQVVKAIRRDGSVSNLEVVRRTKKGEMLTMLFSADRVEVGGEECLLSVSLDISQIKRVEEERRKMWNQVQQVQKLESLGILAGGIAHDFNNLLMGVLGNAGLALMELEPTAPAREYVEKIETTGQRLAELTNQLLAYSGKGKFVTQLIDLSQLAEELTGLLKTAVSKKATLRYQFSQDMPSVEADPTQIRQVVMNLIINASDALEEKDGVITLRTGSLMADKSYLTQTFIDEELAPGLYAFIEVSDTGVGMEEKTQAKIFDPFFTTKFAGRGLGLAAVLGIVRGHRGGIKIYSEPGKGTTVKVLFPALTQPAQNLSHKEESKTALIKGLTVLLADDEPVVRQVAQRTLEAGGCRVLAVRDGQAAVDLFRREGSAIDLVILDMTMPRKNGEEAFREIRGMDPQVPVILSSGYNEQDATNNFSGRGLAGFIQKPYLPSELIQKVRLVLSSKDPSE